MTFVDRLNSFVNRYFVLLMAIALVLAGFLRLLQLGASNLTDQESSVALQALSATRGQDVIIGGQSGYVGLTTLLFALFEGSDLLARFWPALFGIVLVIVPGLFRKQFGELATLILAFLIAFEPGLVALSRSANGTMITITALLLAIGLLKHRKMIPAGIFGGLAMASSENVWPLVFALFLAWMLAYLIDAEKKKTKTSALLTINKVEGLRLGLSALITILLVSSQYLLNANGISGIGSSLTDYFAKWQTSNEMGQGQYLLIMLITQFPAMIFGIWGLVNGLKEKSSWSRLLGLWWVTGLLLSVITPGHDVLLIAMVNLPLYVLSAIQLASLIGGLAVQSKFVLIAEIVVSISLMFFSILNFLNMINFPPGDTITMRNRILGIFLPLALWIAFTVLLAWGWDSVSSKSGVAIGLGLMMGLLLVGSGWKAAGLGSVPQVEFIANSGMIVGHKDLFKTVEEISLWNTGQKDRIDVRLVGLKSPSIVWAFRNFEKTTSEEAFPVNDSPSIVITGMDAVIQTQSLYRGQMLVWSQQPEYSQSQWQDWPKWFFNREFPTKKTNLLLWVRNDLFKDTAAQN
ncbi:MAG: hypothetical protein CVU45_00130 [Chloroflexi bacterium HGW-Chloroflexi-7]|nr:MAG: hypothetical protein CVU45_00130 [Chloroflexi bacterium HGW-Chloroflexi-7]